jgi:hypothetical protein
MSFTTGLSFNNSGKNGFDTKVFNTNTSHPLIPSSQEYIYYKKYVSIHSEDRDMLKYPSASNFEIEIPEDLLNVIALRLYDWSFPCNYNTFSQFFSNTTMTFKINNPYNPNTNGLSDLLVQKIFEYLFYNSNNEYSIQIEDGFYNPIQMATELTNKFNTVVTNQIISHFTSKSVDPSLTPVQQQEFINALALFNQAGGYTNFVVVYNSVGNKLWYGNVCDGFILTTETQFITSTLGKSSNCSKFNTNLPDYSNWGLPGYLGLTRINTPSISGSIIEENKKSYFGSNIVPRFYYGSALTSGDNGYWLLPNPNLPGSEVHWIEPAYKINLMGPSYIYMELSGQNCIDETSPYNISQFTVTTNKTNGVVNSAFAKISIPTTPISQWFDDDSGPYKFYYPPAERLRKFNVRFRYHDGQIVDFGTFNFTFTLEFTLQLPQILRDSTIVKYPDNMF